jgi:hypothetical protein
MIAETASALPDDVLSELKWFTLQISHEHHQAMQSGEGFPPLPGQKLDSPKLREAFNRLLESRTDIEKLQAMLSGITRDLQERLKAMESLGENLLAMENEFRERIGKLQDQLLEDRVNIDQLQSGRKRPPHKITLIRPALVQALRNRELPNDEILRVLDDLQEIYEPATKGTQRVRRLRTREAILQPVPEGTVIHEERKPAANVKSKPVSKTRPE